MLADRFFQFAINLGYGIEQSDLGIMQTQANFIFHLGLMTSHLVGFPQNLDLVL